MANPRLDKSVLATSAESLTAAQKKRQAAPSWSDVAHEFGAQGLQHDEKGHVTGYQYPTIDDPSKRKRRDLKVLEMWERHRRISTDMGAEVNAKRQSVTLVDRRTGKERTVPAERAERLARKANMAEKWHIGRPRTNVDFAYIPGAFDPHERFYRAHETDAGWRWTARLGGRHGDIIAEGIEPTKERARAAATTVLLALNLPDLPPNRRMPAVYVH
jgi:hypothetical protein